MISLHVTVAVSPLATILPKLDKIKCGLVCQSKMYSIIVSTLFKNFASVTNLPGTVELL